MVRVDRDASRPGKLVVDVMRPWKADPQQVFEFAEGPEPVPPDAPLRLQVAALAETLPEREAKPTRVDTPRRPPRAPSTSTAPSTPVEEGPQPVGSLLAEYLKRVAPEVAHLEPKRAQTLLSLSKHSQYLDPLTFSHSLSPSEKGSLEGRAIESPPRSICGPTEPSRAGPGSAVGQRIIDRHERLWRVLKEPGLYQWITVLCAYLVETGQVAEAVIEDVAYSCKITVQDGRARRPGASAGRLFGSAITRRLKEINRWLTLPELRRALAGVGVAWQSHWDGGFKPGGRPR